MHNSILNTPLAALRGRPLLSSLSALTAAGLVDAPFVAGALGSARSLGRLAVQAPNAEGTWSSLKVEGAIPQELNGDLYRVAPGEKTNHGVELRHYFDGDAFPVDRAREVLEGHEGHEVAALVGPGAQPLDQPPDRDDG